MRKRTTRKGGRAFVGPPIQYGNISTWGTTNYYKDNLMPKIFYRTPNHYNGGKTRKNKKYKDKKYKGGFFDESRRLFQPLTNAWRNMSYGTSSTTAASSGSYPPVNPSPLVQPIGKTLKW
jgi:hypothetical protein